ncbi:MAG: histidine phosphatase family protein, partial [Candidatus Marinimicrobia bacterium]|nr:histidine phosphatase family protein [Candidatus Neomarinimicrobiota bacterium]
MRHASAASIASADRERPLTIAGRQEADLMGQMLSLRGPRPEMVISSGAARATETARIVGRWLGLED